MNNNGQWPVRCSRCGGEIGRYETGPDGRAWLRLIGSGILIKDMNAVCDCGTAWNFHASDKMLEDLLNRVLESRHG